MLTLEEIENIALIVGGTAGAVAIAGAAVPIAFVRFVPGAVISAAVGVSYIAGATVSGIEALNCYRYLFGPDQCLFSGGLETCVYSAAAAAMPFVLGKVARRFVVKAADRFSRVPKSLMDEMVLGAAKQGKGRRIISNLGDSRFKGMEKWSYSEKSASGLHSEVHYVRDPKTGQLFDFKFVHHATVFK